MFLRFPQLRLAASVLALLAFASQGSAQDAWEPLRYEVEARLDDDALEVTTQIRARGRGGEMRVWLYTDRFGEVPEAMDQQSARWIFPRERDLSSVEGLRVEANGEEVEATRVRGQGVRRQDALGTDVLIDLPASSAPREYTVRITHRQRLPNRFGRFGRVGERRTLAGPWYPLLIADGENGYRVQAEHHVRICGASTPAHPAWVEDGACVVRETRDTYLPVFLADHYESYQTGSALVRSHRRLYEPPPANRPGIGGVRDLTRARVLDGIRDVDQHVRATLRLAGIGPRPDPLVIVLSPSRTELAATAGDVIMASDRLYELLPVEDVRALHDRALARALFRWHIGPRVDAIDGATDAAWADDLRAVFLTDLDLRRRHGEVTTPRDLLSWAAFNPVVDQLLYAPQVAFADALFGIVDEPDAFRADPARARFPFARGRRLVEHARDRLPEGAFARWARALLALSDPARASLAEIAPDADLVGWLRSPTMPVNYRLGEISSEARDGGFVHRIEIIRDGAERNEPVEVRVRAADGESVVGTWDGEGQRGIVEIETRGRRRSVLIDPRRRLPQEASLADGHPLRDDTDTLRFRPPLTQKLNVAFSTEGTFIGLLDLALRRQYDLEHALALNLNTGPRSRGASLRYVYSFGRKRDTNSRVARVTTGVFLDRLRSGFFENADEDDNESAWRTGFFLFGTYNDQRYFIDPRAGLLVRGGIRGALVREPGGRNLLTLTPSVRLNLTVPLGLRTALVLVGSGAYVIGNPIATQLPSLAGRFSLRGYQTDELTGRGTAFAVAELRFTPTAFSDLSVNLFHIEWLREIQLALFAGAGGVLDRRDPNELPYGVEVGAGVRFHTDHGGIQPGILVIDVAVPLVRRGSSRPPLTAFFAFEQFF